MSKVIKFKNSKEDPNNNDDVLEEGQLDNLSYKIYKRGNIHIFDKNLIFKKGADVLEKIIDETNFHDLDDGGTIKIKGSGDNDTLVFTRKDDEIELSLEKFEFHVITKLKEILKKGTSYDRNSDE